MKIKYFFIFVLGLLAFVSCGDDDEIKPSDRTEDNKQPVDPITWSTKTYSYYTYVWQHNVKGDTCRVTKESASFYFGRNYSDGNCYVKHVKGTEPIDVMVNYSQKDPCSGCFNGWYMNVSGFKYLFIWGGRKYWVSDIPSELK